MVTKEQIHAVLVSINPTGNYSDDTDLLVCGLDSLDLASVIPLCEARYGVMFDDESIRWHGVRTMAEFYATLLGPVMRIECQHSALLLEISAVYGEDPVSYASSGTTGVPRPHLQYWSALMKGTSLHGTADHIVVLGYPVRTFAGLSVLAYARRHDCTLRAAPLDQLALLLNGASHLCTTPTLMRRLLMGPANLSTLQAIILGGEAASASLLADLRQVTQARIVQTYASSEYGLCLSWSDGKGGIPVQCMTDVHCWLTEDGELRVRNQPTGDYFREEHGRAYFAGRAHGLVNVAGQTVQLGEIERILLQVPGVTDARVTATPSTLTGHVLFADLVGSWDTAIMEQVLAALPRVARPYLKRVDTLPMTPAGKVAR